LSYSHRVLMIITTGPPNSEISGQV